VRGVCPEGWHLPDTTEWRTLLTAVGGYLSAGTKLKTASGWLSDDLGTDNFGFSALGVGSGSARIDYGYEGSLAYFHSSVECDDDIEQNRAYKNGFAYEVILTRFETALLEKEVEFEGFSVRCVKD
jgi:uncharacterized protein (TIGR02145 family)